MPIRDAVEADLPAIVEIYNETIPSRMVTGDIEPLTVAQRLAWFYDHSCDRRPLWVMEKEDKVVAWIGCQSFYGRPAYDSTVELSLYVDAAYRGQGIGRCLLQHAIERSPALGIITLLGFIFAQNLPSIGLFESLGFQRWGYLPQVAEFDGVCRDLVIVGLRLKEADN